MRVISQDSALDTINSPPALSTPAAGRVLVFALPAGHKYRVLLIERDLDEVLEPQARMIARRGEFGCGNFLSKSDDGSRLVG